MQSLAFTLLTIAVVLITAQQNINQTAPFNLVISAPGSTIDHCYLKSCHEGAAIEGLCLSSSSKSSGSTYYLNYTSRETYDPIFGIMGLLTWDLNSNSFNLSSPMELSYSAISNIAVPLFTPSETGTIVGFDNENKMFIPGYIDDTKGEISVQQTQYYRWFVCKTYAGYRYQTLAWIVGRYSIPQNPTCQKAEVVKEVIKS